MRVRYTRTRSRHCTSTSISYLLSELSIARSDVATQRPVPDRFGGRQQYDERTRRSHMQKLSKQAHKKLTNNMSFSGQAVLCANLQRRLRVRLSSCGILLITMLSAFLERLEQVHRSRINATAEPVNQRPIFACAWPGPGGHRLLLRTWHWSTSIPTAGLRALTAAVQTCATLQNT